MQYFFLVEGETEQALVNALYIGQVRVVNLWCLPRRKIFTLLRVIPHKSAKVMVVCDTDRVDPLSCSNFIANFNSLVSHVGAENVALFQQSGNLEHELLYCMGIQRARLWAIFNRATGDAQLKKHILSDRLLLQHLHSNGFDVDKLWGRPNCHHLKPLSAYIRTSKTCAWLQLRPEAKTLMRV